MPLTPLEMLRHDFVCDRCGARRTPLYRVRTLERDREVLCSEHRIEQESLCRVYRQALT